MCEHCASIMTPMLDYHVLDFFSDDDDGCALTALIHDTRFHLIVDLDDLKEKDIIEEYRRLLDALRRSSGESSGHQQYHSTDSGVDLPAEKEDAPTEQIDENAEQALHLWMIEPLQPRLEDLASQDERPEDQTLEQWYMRPTYFFSLQTGKDGKLAVTELASTHELENRMHELIPKLSSMPKYISNIPMPWHSASDIQVLDCSDFGGSYHPTRVRLRGGKETYFLKLVDNEQPQPTKREIAMLHQLTKKGLYKQIRCPQLISFVTLSDAKPRKDIMGFLQTDIPRPTPLTTKLDTSVPQHQRDAWAAESQRIKDVLHEHGIIWGDAKADNFMVDASDDLWIIDFGGSYTEGWVDPELQETREGDEMGVEKIVNALRNPVKNICDADEDSGTQRQEDAGSKEQNSKVPKRKRVASEQQNEDDRENRRKTRKRNKVRFGNDSETYCYCGGPESGRMIGCDDNRCEMQWFHFECAGLEKPPRRDTRWYCEDCRSQ